MLIMRSIRGISIELWVGQMDSRVVSVSIWVEIGELRFE